MELVVFSGIQCSGKSTFFLENFGQSHHRVNLDTLKARSREALRFAELLGERLPIVVDNTNPQKSDRARYIGFARELGYRVIGYQFVIPLSLALGRSSGRINQKPVPVADIHLTFRKMQPLAASEGFDEIFVVSVDADGSLSVRKAYP